MARTSDRRPACTAPVRLGAGHIRGRQNAVMRTTQRSRSRDVGADPREERRAVEHGHRRDRAARARAGRRHRGAPMLAAVAGEPNGVPSSSRARPSVSRMSASSSTTRMSWPDMGGRSGGVARGIVTRAAYLAARASRAGARRPSRPAGARRHGGGRGHPVRGLRASRTGADPVEDRVGDLRLRALDLGEPRPPRPARRGSCPSRSPPPPRQSCSRPRDASASPSASRARSR